MKAALQISGQQRYGNFFREFLTTLSGSFDQIDVFVHNWSGPNNMVALSKLIQGELPKKCKLQVVHIQPQINFEIKPEWSRHPGASNDGGPQAVIFRLISQIYGIWAANKLRTDWQKTHDVQYDRVIRGRTDFKIEGTPKFDDPNIIYTGAPRIALQHQMMQDQFACGSPEKMDIYADMYNQLDVWHAERGGFHPEMFFYWWTHLKNGIQVDQSGFVGVMENQHIIREQRDVK
jgi:hypothetical protein